MTQQGNADIGVTGLAVMGRNLARNLARHGNVVALHNRSPERTRSLVSEHGDEGTFVPAESMKEFVASLGRPRAIIIMVKAGEATDAVIDELVPLLDEGDIVIDCGNAHFMDTRRREAALREHGLHFVGCGVSGGEEGALLGPSIMPGGSPESYQKLGPIFESIAAQVDGTPCCTHVGPDGAGHFVKMVHNGIEYADMQLIAEAYDLLRAGLGASAPEIAGIFRTWNEGDLDSFLIEITAQVLAHTDAETGQPFVDIVLDQAEQKGTGRWTVQSALDLGIPITGIAEATFARALSGHADQRAAARAAFGTGVTSPQIGDTGRVRRRRPPGALRVQGGRLRPGLRSHRRGQRRIRLGHRPGRDGDHLARRLHHPGPVPGPHPGGLRRRTPRCPACWSRRTSPRRSGTGWTAGAGWWPRPRWPASRPRRSLPHWPTTTACARNGCPPP